MIHEDSQRLWRQVWPGPGRFDPLPAESWSRVMDGKDPSAPRHADVADGCSCLFHVFARCFTLFFVVACCFVSLVDLGITMLDHVGRTGKVQDGTPHTQKQWWTRRNVQGHRRTL